jgi:hypothetical protein
LPLTWPTACNLDPLPRLARECAGESSTGATGNGKPLLPRKRNRYAFEFVEQATMAHQDKRLRFLWEIDKKLQEDEVLPIVYHTRAVTCTQRQLKVLTVMVDSQYNGWRMEDVWLEP